MWFSTCTLRTALADLHGEDLIWLIAIIAAPASGSAQSAPAGLEPATLRLQVQSLTTGPPGHSYNGERIIFIRDWCDLEVLDLMLYEFRLVSKPRARIMISRNHQIGKLRRGSGAGLEPTTSSYPDQCSNHLSYPALRHSNSPIRQFHDNTAVSISTHLSAVC